MSREAMKLALEALEEITDEVFSPYDNKLGEAINALREALAEQPAQQEPVGEVGEIDIDEDGQAFAWLALHKNVDIGDKLYTSPPAQRTWVGLTDEEITAARDLNIQGGRMRPYSFAKAIEAKLRERNT